MGAGDLFRAVFSGAWSVLESVTVPYFDIPLTTFCISFFVIDFGIRLISHIFGLSLSTSISGIKEGQRRAVARKERAERGNKSSKD